MISGKGIVDGYAGFVAHHPWIMVLVVIFLSVMAAFGSSMIQTESMDYSDMLPDDLGVISALNKIGDQFGGSNSAMIAIELDSHYLDSNEPRDVRDEELLVYIDILTEAVSHVDEVTGVSSATTLLRAFNGGSLPKDHSTIIGFTNDIPMFDAVISKDYALTLIRISLSEDFTAAELVNDLQKVVDEIPKPTGVTVSLAGETVADPIVESLLEPDMRRTSNMSLIGIVVILFLIFRSFRYSITPLATIGVGIMWAMGYIGLTGMGMNSATSGVISMIMGIGIDFGIQTVMRFRQELKTLDVEQAMSATLSAILMPMTTTTLSALIGFRAMTWGNLTFMADMGIMMSYGVTACFFAAITAVPAILVIGENISRKRQKKKRGVSAKKSANRRKRK